VIRDLECPPLPPTRMRHRGDKIDSKGRVSALCFPKPRAIDMKRATWVMSDGAVTCPKCMAMIAAKKNGEICMLTGKFCGKGGPYCQACCKTPNVGGNRGPAV
jgi:hypothetical protein